MVTLYVNQWGGGCYRLFRTGPRDQGSHAQLLTQSRFGAARLRLDVTIPPRRSGTASLPLRAQTCRDGAGVSCPATEFDGNPQRLDAHIRREACIEPYRYRGGAAFAAGGQRGGPGQLWSYRGDCERR
jgi:hypothetical protein